MRTRSWKTLFSLILFAAFCWAAAGAGLTLDREGEWLLIQGAEIPGNEIRIHYLEAYCRAGSTEADWVKHTVIPHTNELISLSADKRVLRLRDTLADGLIVTHSITAGEDEVDFRLVAQNPAAHRSEAHWAQPCVRLGAFTGFSDDLSRGNLNDYLPKCFILWRANSRGCRRGIGRHGSGRAAGRGFGFPGRVETGTSCREP